MLAHCGIDSSSTNDSQAIKDRWCSWCRLCAKDDLQSNVDIFLKNELIHKDDAADSDDDLGLATVIEKYFCVKMAHDITKDALSKMLCAQCLSLLKLLLNFSKRVAKVQEMFSILKSNDNVNLSALRLKYGLLDVTNEHVMQQLQPLLEVHYIEGKSQINALEEKLFEADAMITNDPLEEESHITIKTENLTEEACINVEVREIDPFNGAAAEIQIEKVDVDFVPHNLTDKVDENHPRLQSVVKTECQHEELEKRVKRIRKQKIMIPTENSETDAGKDADENSHNKRNQNNMTELYSCSECPRKFKRAQHYSYHLRRTHAIIPNLSCTQCELSFTNQYRMERHLKTHLPVELMKKIPCPHCEKKFSSNTNMQSHIKYVHMNERPFICEECGIAISTAGNLKAHMLTHTDYAPYKCEMCEKSFKIKKRLRNHMETHDPSKHICAECGLQLNSRATLNRHLLVHSDVMQHKCDYCGRAFKRAKTLKIHLILHTGLKPYSCDFCERTFANGANCRSHKKKAHPEELAALEAAGGGKTYTRNIPKLKALKAVTKAADNLVPVVSKKSGCFAFIKKSTPLLKDRTPNTTDQSKKQQSAKIPDEGVVNVAPKPTIDNIYSHIMK